MKKETKQNKIKLLAENLSKIDSTFSNIFLCPICFKKIASNKLHKISKAHIIPKAAKGKEKTYLCLRCNSQFGTNQDKWFGELSKLHMDNKHLLEQELIGRNFIFDDKKVSGRWFTRENGNFAFLFNANKNSPTDLEQFKKYFSSSKVKISLEYPILSKRNQIKKGYLTAAYLYCFSIFGYSWIKQSYLDILRKIILNKGTQQKITSPGQISSSASGAMDWKNPLVTPFECMQAELFEESKLIAADFINMKKLAERGIEIFII